MIVFLHTLILLTTTPIDNTECPSVVAGAPTSEMKKKMNELNAFLDQFQDMSMFTGYMIYVCWQMFRET